MHRPPIIQTCRVVLAWTAIVVLFQYAPDLSRAEQSAIPASNGPRTGTLRGTVALGPKVTSRRMRFNLYEDFGQTVRASAAPPLADEMSNVIVYLEPVTTVPGGAGRRDGPLRIEQRNQSFVPHTLAVFQGSEVEFPNMDLVFHNVFSLSKAASFDLGRYPRGSSKTVRFDKPGIVKVFCHIHSDMSAVVLVLDTPLFTVPVRDGTFDLGGIPPGEYRATAWHERAHPSTRSVQIEPGRTTSVSFAIPLDETAGGD